MRITLQLIMNKKFEAKGKIQQANNNLIVSKKIVII